MPRIRRPRDIAERQASATAASNTVSPQTDVRQRIAHRAYERFQIRGSEPGRDQEDWFKLSAS